MQCKERQLKLEFERKRKLELELARQANEPLEPLVGASQTFERLLEARAASGVSVGVGVSVSGWRLLACCSCCESRAARTHKLNVKFGDIAKDRANLRPKEETKLIL